MKLFLLFTLFLTLNVNAVEQQKRQLLLGEVTGHISGVPYSQIKALVTDHEVILKEEIQSVTFKGSRILGNLSMLRFKGQYILQEDIKGVVLLDQNER